MVTMKRRIMTTLCFNSVENEPFVNKGLSQEELRLMQVIQSIKIYGVEDKYIFKVSKHFCTCRSR